MNFEGAHLGNSLADSAQIWNWGCPIPREFTQGRIQDLVRGMLNLHSGGRWDAARVCMARRYSVTNFPNASNFSKWRAKKRSWPTATRIMDRHLTFLQLLELLCAPFPTDKDYLRSLKNMTCHALPLSASKNLERGAIAKPGGRGAESPLSHRKFCVLLFRECVS